ncbi:MAG: carbonic anhydrase [Bacteroidales bacterium]|nr:carbonic anhydrase [Bacteroidales bacterium]MCF8391382.1 carbonic anhydrase [Bacteroidales bacterium]
MERLLNISESKQIPERYQGTPIFKLFEYHNLGKEHDVFTNPQMLIGSCMDFRLSFNIPRNFSYMIRTGGANMANMEFKISFAISVGDIKHIAIIGHSDCAMTKLSLNETKFVRGLVKHAKWTKKLAIKHFNNKSLEFGIKDEIDFTLKEVSRLRKLYPGIDIVPLIYKIEDCKLALINE